MIFYLFAQCLSGIGKVFDIWKSQTEIGQHIRIDLSGHFHNWHAQRITAIKKMQALFRASKGGRIHSN